MKRFSTLLLFISLLTATGSLSTAYAASRAPGHYEHGAVVSASIHASEAGVEILQKGGNAYDAAAATGFALAVTFPQAGNLGGGGFMVAVEPRGKAITLDFREVAPKAAHRDMYLDAQGEVIEGLSLRSPLASGVPGSVDGLLRMWEDHGSGNISRRELLAPAIRLASRGFEIPESLANQLNLYRDTFAKHPASAEIFIRSDRRPWRRGDLLKQKDLSRALKRISKKGRDGFYACDTADMIADQHVRTGGLITRDDLAEYTSKYREPVSGRFKEFEVVSMGPPSSGGILIIHMLNMLERFDIQSTGWNSAATIHVLTEIQRRAYADRATHLGDSDFYDVPLAWLGSKAYAHERVETISLDRATPSSEINAGAVPTYESEETTHYSVVDSRGTAIAITTTLNGSFGSGITIEGAGFLMNNEMDDFSSKPGVPNLYGLVGNEANAIAPGKRMLSSMSPTVVLKEGRPWLVLGSPGGSTIITTVLQNLLNVTEHGMNIQEAIAAPRHHSQWLPDKIVHEPYAFTEDTRAALVALGHKLEEVSIIGQANAIQITPEGVFTGPDPRNNNAAAGY